MKMPLMEVVMSGMNLLRLPFELNFGEWLLFLMLNDDLSSLFPILLVRLLQLDNKAGQIIWLLQIKEENFLDTFIVFAHL